MATTERLNRSSRPSWVRHRTGIRAGKSPEHPVGIIGHLAGTFVERDQWISRSVAAGHTYRLPSEAEWKYACRAGSPAAFHFRDDRSQLDEYDLVCRQHWRTPTWGPEIAQRIRFVRHARQRA